MRPSLVLLVLLTVLPAPAVAVGDGARPAARSRPRVVVLGFDGADARLVERWMESGDLPNLAKLRQEGTYAPLMPTNPPQTPVSWSAFATGLNPGRTQIFDFLKRTEGTYLPDFAMATPEKRDVMFGKKNPLYLGLGAALACGLLVLLLLRLVRLRWGRSLLLAAAVTGVLAGPLYFTLDRYAPKRQPWARNGRHGEPFWKVLEAAGRSATVLRLPVTFPAEEIPGGFMLSGLGVPDMRGGIGTPTVWTTDPSRNPKDNEFAIRVVMLEKGDETVTDIIGPENLPFYAYAIDMAGEGIESRDERKRAERDMKDRLEARGVPKTLSIPLRIRVDRAAKSVTLTASGQSQTLREGEWSDWFSFLFPVNWLVDRASPVRGMARFHLFSVEPELNLYLAPVNFHPDFHPVPFSYPPGWASSLSARFGLFKTIGWDIDTWTMSAGLADEKFTLEDARITEEKWADIMEALLAETDDDVFVQVFTGPDRAAHMLWRLEDPGHPLYDARAAEKWGGALREVYRQMDRIVGRAREKTPADAVFIVCSDHGFASYRRGINYNTWLAKNGFMTLTSAYYGEAKTLEDLFHGGSFFENVDWSRTKAYAMGLGEIYVNVEGREPQGIVKPGAEYDQVRDELIRGLQAYVDPLTGEKPVYRVYRREEMYSQFDPAVVPDLRAANRPNYRVEWQTALGGFTPEVVTENRKPWSGDHCSVEPSLVRGILFINRRIRTPEPRIIDLAPTLLAAAGVPPPAGLDGVSLLPAAAGE